MAIISGLRLSNQVVHEKTVLAYSGAKWKKRESKDDNSVEELKKIGDEEDDDEDIQDLDDWKLVAKAFEEIIE